MDLFTDADLELISTLCQHDVNENDVYTFEIRLCDNEVDRDFECFSTQTLKELASLFIGKAGIIDNNRVGQDQVSRIYKTKVVYEPDRKTKTGDDYCWLKGYGYILRTGINNALIDKIEAGIKKEVSIGCSVERAICSICGSTYTKDHCHHERGQIYDGRLCYVTLEDARDVYEFAFVVDPR